MSQFYRESEIAYKSGKMSEFWESSSWEQAWLTAYIEETELLEAVKSYVRAQEVKNK